MTSHTILVGFSPSDYPSISAFDKIGDCTCCRYDLDYLRINIHKYTIIIPHLFIDFNSDLLRLATNLQFLATPSTGTDHIDIDYLTHKGIKLLSLNDDRSFINEITSTAEMAFMLILACARKLRKLNYRVQDEASWSNTDIRGLELNGKNLGIIGYGRLGKIVAKYGSAFGMNVFAYDIDSSQYDNNIQAMPLNDLLAKSDFVSLHAKLNTTSKNIINNDTIRLFKPGSCLINTARGSLVDSDALLYGLNSGILSEIATDVCSNEFQSSDLPLDPLVEASRTDRRILITPHAGGSTHDAHSKVFSKLSEIILSNL